MRWTSENECRWEEKITCSRLLVSLVNGNSGMGCCAIATDLDVGVRCDMGSGWPGAEGEDSSWLEWKR
jgi:hypothetical protein